MASVDLKEFVEENTDRTSDDNNKTIIEHLEELRWRIFKCLIAITITSIIAFVFRTQLLQFLELPLPAQSADVFGHKLVVTGLGEGFTVFLELSIIFGVVLALPVILYQLWAFIVPALLEREKKYALPFISAGLLLFVSGVALGYIVLRFPIQWLIDFSSTSFTELLTAESYFTFVSIFMLVFGLVFEIPLVLTLLAQLGIISSALLIKRRMIVHFCLWAAATFLTPGADIYSPVILGVAMSFLYELSIIFIRIIRK